MYHLTVDTEERILGRSGLGNVDYILNIYILLELNTKNNTL